MSHICDTGGQGPSLPTIATHAFPTSGLARRPVGGILGVVFVVTLP